MVVPLIVRPWSQVLFPERCRFSVPWCAGAPVPGADVLPWNYGNRSCVGGLRARAQVPRSYVRETDLGNVVPLPLQGGGQGSEHVALPGARRASDEAALTREHMRKELVS